MAILQILKTIAKGIVNILFPLSTFFYFSWRLLFPTSLQKQLKIGTLVNLAPFVGGIGAAIGAAVSIYLGVYLAAKLGILAGALLGFTSTVVLGWVGRAMGTLLGHVFLSCLKLTNLSIGAKIKSSLSFGIYGTFQADIQEKDNEREFKTHETNLIALQRTPGTPENIAEQLRKARLQLRRQEDTNKVLDRFNEEAEPVSPSAHLSGLDEDKSHLVKSNTAYSLPSPSDIGGGQNTFEGVEEIQEEHQNESGPATAIGNIN